MHLTYLSLLGGLAMLIVGLLDYAFLRAVLYRPLRWRYESAKARGRIGVEPNVIMGVLKVSNLLLLPVLGVVFGDQLLRPFL